jgi:hypothetical protein
VREKLQSAEMRIAFVPMPPEQYEAWKLAMQIISGYLRQARAEAQGDIIRIESIPLFAALTGDIERKKQ